MNKVDINNRYLEEEEVRKDKLPYMDYFSCLNHTFNTIDSFCDIGCATGHLLFFVKTMNSRANVKGFEYFDYHKNSTYCEPLIKNSITICDIRDPLPEGEKYDIVNCSEVGEHIEASYASALIENAKRLSKKYIIFTWSSHGGHLEPHKDPHHQHLNPLSREAYMNLMKSHGLKENKELTQKFLNKSFQCSNFHFWWRESFIIWEL